jgi:hypothetical protein
MATGDDKLIREQREDLAKEIKEVNAKLKPGFQKIIKDLEEVSPQVAKITADFRESSKDSFTGALATKKLKNLTGLVDKYMKEGESALDPKELKQLQSNFSQEINGVMETFDFEGMRQAQIEFNETQDKIQELEDGRQARLEQSMKSNNVLAQLDKKIEEARSKSIGLNGAAADANNKLIQDLQREREDKADKMTAAYDREIAAERKTLEERSEALSETTEAYKTGLEKATKFEGTEKFSSGIEELTGIDILGFADTVTKKVNAISDIMGSIGGVFGEAGEGLKDKVTGFMGGVKDFFTPKGKEGGGDSPIGGAIKGKADGMAKGMSDKAADKGVGLPAKSGKSGGFLKSIANGVKKFGDSKVLKGALTLGILGGTVGLLAIGLKAFNGLDFKTMFKGFVALGALIMFARLIGKATFGILKGALAIGVLGAALIPFAFALKLMKDAGLGTILTIAVGLTALGVAAAILGGMLPVMLLGAVAIAALGAALIPFAFAAEMAAGAFNMFIGDLIKISLVDGANLILVGAGLAAIGAGLVAMTGGNLLGSLMEGIGSLFGAKSPMEKVTDFAKGLQDVDMTKITQLGVAFEKLQNAEGAIKLFSDVDGKAKSLKKFAESIDLLSAALIRLESGVPKEESWWDKMTSFAGKMMGTTEEERIAEQAQKSQQRLDGISGGAYYAADELDDFIGTGGDVQRQPSAMSMEMSQVKAELTGQRQAEEIRLSKLQEMMLEHNIVARQKFGIPHLYSPEEISAAGVQDQGGMVKNARQEVSATASTGNQIAMASNQNIVNQGRTYNNLNKPQTNNDDYSVYKFGGAMGIGDEDF